jgi:hypothetical protein
MPGFNDATIDSSIDYRQSQLLASAGERTPAPLVRWARQTAGSFVVRIGERLRGDQPITTTAPAPTRLVMS